MLYEHVEDNTRMQAAKRIEREYERTAERADWADPTTVTFEETEPGQFEVYAEDESGDTYLIGFENVVQSIEQEDVDEMLREQGLRDRQITDQHRREMREYMEQEQPGSDELGYRVLQRVQEVAPGMMGEGYVQDGQRLVFTGQRNRMTTRIPAGVRPGMLDEHDQRRLVQEVDMRLSAQESELVATMGKNCVVVDTRFDTNGQAQDRLHGRTEVLNAPIAELRELDIDPEDIFVVEREKDEVLFVESGDYYFRGTNDGSRPAYDDGWIGVLDRPAESIEQVKAERLRPDSVLAAEHADLDVKRQGDWFFIEQHDDFMPTGVVRTPELQPTGECDFLDNHAAEWLGMDALNPKRVFVKGDVEHLNDDHDVMELGDTWWTAQHNGIESRSFECDEYDAEVQGRGMYSHPESHGGLL